MHKGCGGVLPFFLLSDSLELLRTKILRLNRILSTRFNPHSHGRRANLSFLDHSEAHSVLAPAHKPARAVDRVQHPVAPLRPARMRAQICKFAPPHEGARRGGSWSGEGRGARGARGVRQQRRAPASSARSMSVCYDMTASCIPVRELGTWRNDAILLVGNSPRRAVHHCS
jgi:hypothetical protein